MKKTIDIIVENVSSLSVFSNRNNLLILIYLKNKGDETEATEISNFFKTDIDEINKHLLILEKNDLIKKFTRLDKSTKPAFLKNYYKIEVNNFNKMLENIKKLADSCLYVTN